MLAAHGRDVPRDVSVVGFDNLATAATTSPPLTTVQNPMVEMVRGATDLLLDLVGGRGDEIASQVLAPELVERDPSDPAPSAAPRGTRGVGSRDAVGGRS